jgi:6-phosphogluconolactonase
VLGSAIQTISTLPEDFPPAGKRSAAAILIHPSGKFLYASNRKVTDHSMADSLVAYRIDPLTGQLTCLGFTARGMVCPRTISFDLAGRSLYVLNQKGDSLLQFAIDQETGELSPTRGLTRLKVPVSLVFKQ